MQNPAPEEKEPLKLRIILPLIAVILLLTGIFAIINISKSTFEPMSGPEISASFNSFTAKNPDREHFKLFVSSKEVHWDQRPTLNELLQGIEGSDLVASVSMKYQIPVFINLVGDWIFAMKDNELQVQAPMPTYGEAVLDPTSLQINFTGELSEDQKSVLRETLKESLSAYQIEIDPQTQATLEKESREKLQDLLGKWMTSSFKNIPDLKYQITFSGSQSENPDGL
jgi:hypothetical protein